MGRFNDLWRSGRFERDHKGDFDKYQQEEVRDLVTQLAPEYAVSQQSRDVYAALHSRRGTETGKWLRGLSEQHPGLTEAAVAGSAADAFEEIAAWMGKLFEELSTLAFQFNQTCSDNYLRVSCQKPSIIEKRDETIWYRPIHRSCHGRLTTREWALVVTGENDKITIRIAHSDMVLAFGSGSVSETDFKPLFEIFRRTENGRSVWTLEGEEIPPTIIPFLAKELIGDLIRVTSGAMSEGELFNKDAGTPVLGQTVAVGYSPKPANPVKASAKQQIDIETIGLHEVLDIVDHVVDRDLKVLYSRAAQEGPANSVPTRKEISALEAFHQGVLGAFEEYTRATCTLKKDL